MNAIEYRLQRVSEAVSDAGETCLAIVAGKIAGIGADWIDKWFLTEEQTHSAGVSADHGQPTLGKNKARKMAEKLSANVSTPRELII